MITSTRHVHLIILEILVLIQRILAAVANIVAIIVVADPEPGRGLNVRKCY